MTRLPRQLLRAYSGANLVKRLAEADRSLHNMMDGYHNNNGIPVRYDAEADAHFVMVTHMQKMLLRSLLSQQKIETPTQAKAATKNRSIKSMGDWFFERVFEDKFYMSEVALGVWEEMVKLALPKVNTPEQIQSNNALRTYYLPPATLPRSCPSTGLN